MRLTESVDFRRISDRSACWVTRISGLPSLVALHIMAIGRGAGAKKVMVKKASPVGKKGRPSVETPSKAARASKKKVRLKKKKVLKHKDFL